MNNTKPEGAYSASISLEKRNGGLKTDFFVIAGLTAIIIVAIVKISDIIQHRYKHGSKLSNNALVRIQGDLNAFKKGIDEIKEYITDLYIQQHDEKLK